MTANRRGASQNESDGRRTERHRLTRFAIPGKKMENEGE